MTVDSPKSLLDFNSALDWQPPTCLRQFDPVPVAGRHGCNYGGQTAGAYLWRGFVVVGCSCGCRFSWAQLRANSLSSAALCRFSLDLMFSRWVSTVLTLR